MSFVGSSQLGEGTYTAELEISQPKPVGVTQPLGDAAGEGRNLAQRRSPFLEGRDLEGGPARQVGLARCFPFLLGLELGKYDSRPGEGIAFLVFVCSPYLTGPVGGVQLQILQLAGISPLFSAYLNKSAGLDEDLWRSFNTRL